MALIESTNIPLLTQMPPFQLKTPEGTPIHSIDQIGKKGLLLAFTCNHCPYAIAIWPRLIHLAKKVKPLGINTLAINPNIHPNYPEDNTEMMALNIKKWGIPFPYLIDETQAIAKSYTAQCTPDLYLMDTSMKLVYHGRLDDNWRDETQVHTRDLENALAALATDQPIAPNQYPSMGCSIKWK